MRRSQQSTEVEASCKAQYSEAKMRLKEELAVNENYKKELADREV